MLGSFGGILRCQADGANRKDGSFVRIRNSKPPSMTDYLMYRIVLRQIIPIHPRVKHNITAMVDFEDTFLLRGGKSVDREYLHCKGAEGGPEHILNFGVLFVVNGEETAIFEVRGRGEVGMYGFNDWH